MKFLSFLLIVGLVFLSGCAGKSTFVEIMRPDKVFRGGKVAYTVIAGDTLKVLETKTCKGGFGTCWQVKNTKTGDIGYVKKNRMEEMHRVYIQEKETTEPKKIELPSHIEILQEDKVFYNEDFQYTVVQGDVLNVIKADFCNDEDFSEICWIVEHVTTGKKGKVNAKKMEDIHRVIYSQK